MRQNRGKFLATLFSPTSMSLPRWGWGTRRALVARDDGSRDGAENGGRFTPQSDVPADTGDFEKAPAGGGDSADDDIPF